MINYKNGRETMKVIVKPVGAFMYINAPYGEEIRHNRPSVATHGPFIDTLIARGDLKIFARGLPMKATDAEFFTAYIEAEKDEKLAIEAFCAEFGLSPDGDNIETEAEVEPIDDLDKLSYADLKILGAELGLEFSGRISAVDLKALIKDHQEKDQEDICEEDESLLNEVTHVLDEDHTIDRHSVVEDTGVVIYAVKDKEDNIVHEGTIIDLHELLVKNAE